MRAAIGDNLIPAGALGGTAASSPALWTRANETDRATGLQRAALVAVLLVAGAARFGGLGRESRHGDEYMQTSVYRSSSIRSVINVARTHGQPPLDYVLGWGIAKATDSVAAMRLPAATFGVLGVLATYVLTARLAGPRAGLLAATLLALSPLHVRMSQTARPYTIFVLAWMLTLWSMHAYLAKPRRLRLVLFGLLAYAMVWTNGLGPLVAVTAIALVAGSMWLARRSSPPVTPDSEREALRRLLFASVAVGCLAAPLVFWLLTGAREWTSGGAAAMADTVVRENSNFPNRLLAAIRCWLQAWPKLFGDWGHGVLLLAILGAGFVLVHWRRRPYATRAVWSTVLAAAMLFLLLFAVMVKNAPMRDRYGLFLVPFVAATAAVGADRLLQALARRFRASPRPAFAMLTLTVLIPPAWAAVQQRGIYTNCDWQGCAAVLADQVQDEDVLLVFEDRPLGEYQPPFWGKHDWPKNGPRPLGEAAWTTLTSPTHAERLRGQTGRTFLVLTRAVEGEDADAYLQCGLQTVPPGWTLRKFRGLDVLIPDGGEGGLRAVIAACETAAGVPFAHPDIRAIAFALQARLLDLQGEKNSAQAARDAAWAVVPADRRAWFARLTGDYPMESDAR